MNRALIFAAVIAPLLLIGCEKRDENAGTSHANNKATGAGESSVKTAEESFLKIDKNTTPEERLYLKAGKPFVVALANQKYEEAYRLLSSHAKARMSFNQFVPSNDETIFGQNERNAMVDVTPEKFVELIKKVEEEHGIPRSIKMLSIFSTDLDVLNRRKKEEYGAMDSMFAIGAMPDSVPADIRRASLRGQISTQLTSEQLEKVAKEEGISVGDLKKDPDFSTYFTIKVVLVEEEQQLRVGYFEFLPSSMLD